MSDVLDRIDQFPDFDPRRHYELTISSAEMTDAERGAVRGRYRAAAVSFERLHPALQHHILNSLEWRTLRPLQESAIGPILDGANALLIAPTAGGKTEAAIFPILSEMLRRDLPAPSVLYVCPIRALLNNLEIRLGWYTELIGRTCDLWHGDISQADKSAVLRNPPDILLTTPESVEAMLVSTRVNNAAIFSRIQFVVADELHALEPMIAAGICCTS